MVVRILMNDIPFQPKRLPIVSMTPLTLQDYPNKVACVLWFAGCNFRCAYCHNPDLVFSDYPRLLWTEVESFLEERRGFLDGVVLSGGECTLSPQLPGLARYLKERGYGVKIDTNGSHPVVIQRLLADNLVDYVALDWKAPPERLLAVCGHPSATQVYTTLGLLQRHQVPYELRCTVHSDLLTEADINTLLADLDLRGFTGHLYLQNFQPGKVLGPLLGDHVPLNPAHLTLPKGFEVGLRNYPKVQYYDDTI